MRITFVLALMAGIFLSACNPGTDVPGRRQDGAATQLVAEVNLEHISQAFDRLSTTPHRVERSLEATEPYRYRRRATYRWSDSSYVVEAQEESGERPSGAIARVYAYSDHLPLTETESMFVEDQLYLSPETRFAFSYALAGDTTIGERTARVIHIQRQPDEDRGRPFESVHLYLDASTSDLLALRTEIDESTLFFSETATRYLELTYSDRGSAALSRIEIDSEIGVRFARNHRLNTEWQFRYP